MQKSGQKYTFFFETTHSFVFLTNFKMWIKKKGIGYDSSEKLSISSRRFSMIKFCLSIEFLPI